MMKWRLKIKRDLLWVLILLNNLIVAQNHENSYVKAFVVDTSGVPIQNVNVLIIKEKRIVQFTATNELGAFVIKMDTLKFPIQVSFKALGYFPRDIYINEVNNSTILKFILKESSVNLSEVIINHKRDIAIIGDTIKYRLEAFRRGNEKVLEDVLKNLPGFQIEENGTIKFRNRPIQKILIDGDDLTDRNYKLISKNMPSYVLDEVQVLNNFVDNPLLKGLFKSDEVALNLKFNKKSIFFGNANIGLGTNKRNDISNNIFSILSNFKLYFLITKNNSGFESKTLTNQSVEGHFFNIPKGYLLNQLRSSGTPRIDGAQTLNNDSFLSSLNSIFRPSNKLEIKTNLNFDSNKNRFYSLNSTQYLLSKNTINISEDNNEKILTKTKSIQFSGSYRPNKKKELTVIGEYIGQPSKKDGRMNLNLTNFTESLLQEKKETNINVKYIVRVNENSAIYLHAINKILNTPQNYKYFSEKSYSFENRLGLNQMNNSFENFSNYSGLGVNYLTNVKNISFSTKLGVDNYNEKIVSSLILQDSINNYFTVKKYNNNILERKNTVFFNTEIRLSKKMFDFLTNANLSVFNQKYFDQNFKNDSLFLKRITRSYVGTNSTFFVRLKEGHKLNLNYNLEYNTPELNQLISNYTLSNYRNFIKGSSGEYLLQKTNTIAATYTFDKTGSNTELLFRLNSGKMPSTYNSVYNVSERYIYSALIIGRGSKFYGAAVSLSEYIPLLSSSFKLSGTFRSSSFDNYINSTETRLIVNNNYNSNLSFRTSWKGLLNLDIGTELNYNLSQTNESFLEKDISILNKNYYLYFFLKFSKKINANYKADIYKFSGSPKITFMNLSLDYILIENKLNLSLIGKNLFNKNILYFQTNSDYRKSSVSYSLAPPFLMIKLEYRY